MTVKELKEVLELMDDDAKVSICVREPAGWVCPDGATVGIGRVCRGIDWHSGEVLVVPEYKLNIHDVDAWSRNKSIKKLKMPIDIKKFNEVCEMSKGGLQTFKAASNPQSSAAPKMARRGKKCVKCGERFRDVDVVTFDTPTGTLPRRFICRDCAEEEGIDFEERKDKE